jgi:outer membrane protein OmpA-like peptidoglycan-associated protein
MKLPSVNTVLLALALLLLTPARPGHPAFTDFGVREMLELVIMQRTTPDPADPPMAFAIRKPAALDELPEDAGQDEVGAWQVQIFDNKDRKVSFIQGRNELPGTVLRWNGTSPSGEPLPDGFYRVRLAWIDPAGKPHATGKTLISLSTPLGIRNLSDRKLRFRYTEEGLVIGIAERAIFKPGQSSILEDSLPALREISAFLKNYPEKTAVVRGYTDSSGSPQRNLLLSRERAVRVYRYLVNAGIAAARLAHSGMGASHPLADNTTEEGRSRNRRVEVVVLKTPI